MSLQNIDSAGILLDVTRFGVAWHGAIESGSLAPTLGGAARTWLQPESTACWAIRAPGMAADPYGGDTAARAADAVEGLEFTNWAILSGWGDVHGKRLPALGTPASRAWIWIDSAGSACACSFRVLGGTVVAAPALPNMGGIFGVPDVPQYRFDQPITLRLSLQKFGDLRENGTPATTPLMLDYTLPAGALGQTPVAGSALPDYGTLLLESFSPDGSRIAFAVVSGEDRLPGGLVRRPLGFIELILSGTSESPAIAHGMLADRATTLGSAANSTVVTETIDYSSTSHVDGSGNTVLDSATWIETRDTVHSIGVNDRLVAAEYDETGAIVFASLSIAENATEHYVNSGTLATGASVTIDTEAHATIAIAWGGSVTLARDQVGAVAFHVVPSGDPDAYVADTTISVTDRPDTVIHETIPNPGINYSNTMLGDTYGAADFNTTTTTDQSMTDADLEYWSWESQATGPMQFVRMNENVLGLGVEEIGVVRAIRLIGRLSVSTAQALVNRFQNYYTGPYPVLSVNYCVQHPITGALDWPLDRPRSFA